MNEGTGQRQSTARYRLWFKPLSRRCTRHACPCDAGGRVPTSTCRRNRQRPGQVFARMLTCRDFVGPVVKAA